MDKQSKQQPAHPISTLEGEMSRSDRGGYVPQAPITTIWKIRTTTAFLGAYQHDPPLP